jgi:hypothetical protein
MGINVNLWCGLVLLAFGLTMVLFGRPGQRQIEKDHLLPPTEVKGRRGN